MHSVQKWIWGGIRALGRALRDLMGVVWNVLSSAVTWVVASLAYLVDQFQSWVNGAISNGIGSITDYLSMQSSEFSDVVPLAAYYLDLFSADEAATCIVELFSIWVFARAARMLMVPIRAVLELL